MDSSVRIIVHGRGNAWPVPLGETHPFYDRTDPVDLSNAAYSLLISGPAGVTADILVDAGHGTIQSLITGMNRIPDTICLTHGHMDHTLGVDWVVQSYWRNHHLKYPLYCTLPVFDFLISSYPQLADLIEHRELEPGISVLVGGEDHFTLTAYPVYHGTGAVGASMLMFNSGQHRLLFTGDLITPLLRSSDYRKLKDADLVVDCNNRFPYPGANHWSFAGKPGDPLVRSEKLNDFLYGLKPEDLARPHDPGHAGEAARSYFDDFARDFDPKQQPFTVLEFLKKITPRRVVLVHYSGSEDLKYYREPLLTEGELLSWAEHSATQAGVAPEWIIPAPGQRIQL